MNKQQRDYLTRRLSFIANSKSNLPLLEEPREVVAARKEIERLSKILSDYNTTKRVMEAELRKRVAEAKTTIEDSIYFSDDSTILESLRLFEATQF